MSEEVPGTPVDIRDLRAGDLLFAKGLVPIWHGVADLDSEPEVFGHENCVKRAWLTIMEIQEIDTRHFTKVWLHTPIWGSYSCTIRHMGWLWTEHASSRLELHKIDSVL